MSSRYTALSAFFIFSFLFVQAQPSGTFGELIHSADLGSLTPTPDRHIVGVEVAGGYLWATGYDPDDYWQHKLYKFNSDGTELLDVYSYGIEAAGWNDLAFDGEFLYVSDMDTIRQLDPATGAKTGETIPAPFYYNRGLAYNPLNDHFYVSGEGGSNIYEIDRDGVVIGAIADYANRATLGLAVDTLSPGGPFLWSWSNEYIGYNTYLKAGQISLVTGTFTGIEFDGESIGPVAVETAGGAAISYDYQPDSVTFIGINLRNGNAGDQMEFAMFYDITRNEIPGPQISVTPAFIQNMLPTGDSVDVLVELFNNGDAPLFWSAYIETPEQDTIDNLGDLLTSFNATLQSQNDDRGMNGITFLGDRLWVNGRNFGSQTSVLYEFDKEGQLLAQHPYYSLSSLGFYSITSDGEYLYGEDTYTIFQIEPESFTVAGYLQKPSGSYSGLTYDPQSDHFWCGNGVGLIYEFDREGNEVNVYLTDYDIQGLAWDRWSPGGPYLWAWVETVDGEGSRCEAIRLDPATCTPAGDGFEGSSLSTVGDYLDIPLDAVITDQWEENKVTFLGLQNTFLVEGADTLANHDFVAVYDLDVVPPPGWIALTDTSFGTVGVGNTGQFTVRLRSLMEDTVMTAVIRIDNNDIVNPQVVIPVNFEMAAFVTAAEEYSAEERTHLGQNFPNPSVSSTVIPVTLEQEGPLELRIYNATGILVDVLAKTELGPGYHEFTFSTAGLPPGIYFYSLTAGTESQTRKLIIKK